MIAPREHLRPLVQGTNESSALPTLNKKATSTKTAVSTKNAAWRGNLITL
jgi:hypothetical protein